MPAVTTTLDAPHASAETAGPGPPRLSHMPGLDGLRGLAVIAVFAFHVGHLDGGYLGVDLFFVLSGFLITSLLLVEADASGRIGLGAFWGRRARRLFPALGVLLIIAVLYARFAAFPSELNRIRWDAIATMLYVANWREILTEVRYESLFLTPSPLNHTWSLAIEEQFYLVWPLLFTLVLLATRRATQNRRALATGTLVLAGTLAVASLVTAVTIGGEDDWNRVYYGTDTRAFAILIGAALAAARARFGAAPEGRPRRLLEGAGVVAAVALGLAWMNLPDGSDELRNGGLATCSVAAAVVIAAVSHPNRGPLARVMAFKPLRWMGLISYGVYLYHWPVIVWLDTDLTGRSGWALIGIQVAVTIGLAALSYSFIEQPIRHSRRWTLRKGLTVPALAFAAAGVMVVAGTAGFRPLDAPRVPELGPVAPNAFGARIMVIGDSVPDYIAREGFEYLHADLQPTILNLTVQGCREPPTDLFREADGDTTDEFTRTCENRWVENAEQFQPHFVVFSTVGAAPLDYRRDGEWVPACSDEFHAWVTGRMTGLADQFAAQGARLAVVTSAPENQRLRSDGVYRRVLDATGCWNDALRAAARAAPDQIILVDLAARFCTDDRDCNFHTVHGSAAREDGAHYRGRAALIVGQMILDRLGIPSAIPR